jgi:Ca2+-binding EF-hand superfamily protein
LIPVDSYYATLLNRRTSNNIRAYYRDECFNYGTRFEFKQLFKTHFSVERMAENLRRNLSMDRNFDVYDAFKACDINEDGIITKNEIRKLLEDRGFFMSELEVSTLMNKLDKDKDGRISYYEFMEEMKPKIY